MTAGDALTNTTDVENFPGFQDGIMGPDLIDGDGRGREGAPRRAGYVLVDGRSTHTNVPGFIACGDLGDDLAALGSQGLANTASAKAPRLGSGPAIASLNPTLT